MNAICLPPALRYNEPVAAGRSRVSARRWERTTRSAERSELARLAGFERLRDLGVPRDELGEVAEAAAQRPAMKLNPRPAGPAEIEELLESVLVRISSANPLISPGRISACDLSRLRRARDRKRRLRPRRRRVGRARRRPRRRSRPRARSSRATRRRRRAGSRRRSASDDSPEQHAEDVWKSSHETADTAPGRGPHRGGARRDPLARGARRRVHARERRLPARPVRRRDAQAPAPGRRPHRPRDHEGAARGRSRRSDGTPLPEPSARRARAGRERLARARAASTRSTRRPSSSPPAAAATARPRSAASSRRTTRARPAR